MFTKISRKDELTAPIIYANHLSNSAFLGCTHFCSNYHFSSSLFQYVFYYFQFLSRLICHINQCLPYFYYNGKLNIAYELLTILTYFPIMSASWLARLVCRGSLTPDATCKVQTPVLDVFTETMSSNGRVSIIIRSPLLPRFISRKPWWDTATCCTSGCCGPI